MCAPRFIGEGYSDAFCKNMRAVSEKMKSGDYTLVDTCDDICAACPNNKGGVCADEVKAKAMTKLLKMRLPTEKLRTPRAFAVTVNGIIFAKQKKRNVSKRYIPFYAVYVLFDF